MCVCLHTKFSILNVQWVFDNDASLELLLLENKIQLSGIVHTNVHSLYVRINSCIDLNKKGLNRKEREMGGDYVKFNTFFYYTWYSIPLLRSMSNITTTTKVEEFPTFFDYSSEWIVCLNSCSYTSYATRYGHGCKYILSHLLTTSNPFLAIFSHYPFLHIDVCMRINLYLFINRYKL